MLTPDQQVQQANRWAQHSAKELSLTPDQQTPLQPLLLAQRQQMQVLREQCTTDDHHRFESQSGKIR